MSIALRPVPNQPLFVWPIRQAAISFRGYVQSKQGNHISVYTKVISGTQVGATLPVAHVSSFRSGTVRLYGYFLPTHWLLGATRYRIQLIVHIWNLMVNGIMLTAQVSATDIHHTAISANASLETDSIHMTHVAVSSTPVHNVKLWFNIANIARSLFVMARAKAEQVSKTLISVKGIHDNVRHALKVSASIGDTLIRPLKILANSVTPVLNKALKLSARIPADIMEYASRLSVNLSGIELERTYKMSLDITGMDIERIAKLSVAIKRLDIYQTVKLCAAIRESNIEEISKLLVDIPKPDIERMLKMSAALIPETIVHVLSDIRMDVEAQTLVQHPKITTYPMQVFNKVLYIKTHIGKHINATKGLVVNLLQFVKSMTTDVIFTSHQTVQVIYCPFVVNQTTRELAVHALTSLTHEEVHYLEAQVLTVLGHKNLLFRPVPMPPVHRAQCLVSVCQTAVQAYINMYLDDHKLQTGSVMISVCQSFARRLIQWYLMGGRVSNEGYGNEVIFDLGEINPVGPIPPSPSLTWGGGYVEDPFIGAGYAPTETSTGYASPEVAKWVENVRMYWSNPTEPFEEN